MKWPSPKLISYILSWQLLYSIFLVGSIALSSCGSQPKQEIKTETAKGYSAINGIKKDSFAPPKVTYITAANLPKTVNAGRPAITKQSDYCGNPFFTNYGTEQGLPLSEISCSFVDSLGNLWFGTYGAGVCRYNGKNFTNYTTAQGLAGNLVYSILEDRKGDIWFATTGGGVSRYNGISFTNFTTAQGLAKNNVSSILQDKSGNLWFGTQGGASRYDGKTFKNYTKADGLAGNYISSIIQDRSGNIWFGTEGGASRFDGIVFTNYTKAQGLADDRIKCILQDRSDKIWFGTVEEGVSMYDGKGFYNYSKSQGLPGNYVPCIKEDRSGNIWFGSKNEGVSRFDGEAILLETMAFFCLQNNLSDSSNYLMQQALEVARENHLQAKEAEILGILTYAGGGFFLRDSLISYTKRSLSLSRLLHRDTLSVTRGTALAYKNMGNFPKALQTYLIILHAYEARKDSIEIENTLVHIGYLYQSAKDFKNSIAYYYQSLNYDAKGKHADISALRWMSQSYLGLKQNDSAEEVLMTRTQKLLNLVKL
jgi:streptogramin lyase